MLELSPERPAKSHTAHQPYPPSSLSSWQTSAAPADSAYSAYSPAVPETDSLSLSAPTLAADSPATAWAKAAGDGDGNASRGAVFGTYLSGLGARVSPYQAGLARAAPAPGAGAGAGAGSAAMAASVASGSWRTAYSRAGAASASMPVPASSLGVMPSGIGAELLGPEFDEVRDKLAALSVHDSRAAPAGGRGLGVGGRGAPDTPAAAASDAASRSELARLRQEKVEWTARQQEQLRVIRECLAERDRLQRTDVARQQALAMFRKEITAAVDKLSSERTQWVRQLDEKASMIAALEAKVASAGAAASNMSREAERLADLNRRLQEQVSTTTAKQRTENTELEDRHSREKGQAQSELDRLRAALADADAKHAAELGDKAQTITDLKADKRELENRHRQVESDAAAATRDRDGLQSELALQRARHDAEKAGLASKLKAQCDRGALATLSQEQERAAAELSETRETHRKQIAQLSERHSIEVTELRASRQTEIQHRAQEIQTEQDRHRREMDDLMWKLQEAQGKLRSLSATVKSRENVHSTQVTKLGTELQDTLRAQFASVSKAANELATASQTLTEETKSIVEIDVATAFDTSGLDFGAASPSYYGGGHGSYGGLPSSAAAGIGRPATGVGLRSGTVGLLPSSPARGIKLLHANNQRTASAAPGHGASNLPESVTNVFRSSSLAQTPYANRAGPGDTGASASDRALLTRAASHLSDSKLLLGGGAYAYGSAVPHGASGASSASGARARASPMGSPRRRRQATATGGLVTRTGGSTFGTIGAAPVETHAAANVAKGTQRAGRRDYDKPWLAGRVTKDALALGSDRAAAVDQVYQMLRNSAGTQADGGSMRVLRAPRASLVPVLSGADATSALLASVVFPLSGLPPPTPSNPLQPRRTSRRRPCHCGNPLCRYRLGRKLEEGADQKMEIAARSIRPSESVTVPQVSILLQFCRVVSMNRKNGRGAGGAGRRGAAQPQRRESPSGRPDDGVGPASIFNSPPHLPLFNIQ